MKWIRTALGIGVAIALGAMSTISASAQEGEPIKIGVPMPLTGPLAQAGQLILQGIEFATKEANDAGGLLGRKIELVIEDTKSEPNTAATIGAKMATQDKVFAFVGGYGSTSDIALLQSVRRYSPIFVHAASSSTKIEQAFGKEDWYFHVYIWDYHRQKAATRFFESITPKPKTVAIAYEDGLYGSDAARFSEEYLPKGGFDIVMREPFKGGSPDFSSILTKVKSLNPDVFFLVAYSGDNIQVARQIRDLDIKPKLLLIVSAGEKRTDFGDFGPGVAVIGEWAREQKTEGLQDFIQRAEAFLPGDVPVQAPVVQGYTAMLTLIEGVKAAGSFDRDKVLKALAEQTYNSPYGPIKYKPSEGGAKHQLLTDENMIAWQYKAEGQAVVWPPEKASGQLQYPAN